MVTWDTFTGEAPAVAAVVERRMKDTGLVLLATVRRDGSPRISPLEPLVHEGKLRLGMMPDSTKALDLRREPRCCIHTATADKDMAEGDAKLFGVATEVTDRDDKARYAEALHAAIGFRPEVDKLNLFDVDITGASAAELADGHFYVTVWRPGEGEKRVLKD